ncbi:MAG: hypothetical protein ACI808_001214 [Paraglaciecola sp.]|jgi:hypothetical protein
MFRLLIVSLEIIALVAILQSQFMQYLFSDIQVSIADWMTEISQMAEKQELSNLREVVAPHLVNLNDYQQEYLLEITSSKNKINVFYQMYCLLGDKNPYIYGASLHYFCSEIRQSKVLG